MTNPMIPVEIIATILVGLYGLVMFILGYKVRGSK